MASTLDINTIPYDAPLSFTPPEPAWVNAQNRKVVISGSNNGIGREAALQFAEWGANLVLACRKPPPTETDPEDVVIECLIKARAAGHETTTVEWWELNCASTASVEAFAKRWLDTGRALDILCNNAGMGSSPGGQQVFKTPDGFKIIHQVRSAIEDDIYLLTRLSSGQLSMTRPPHSPTPAFYRESFETAHRIYDLTDFNGEKAKPGWDGVQYYMNNKLFFQIWLTELQRRLLQHDKYKHIIVNGVHPG